VGTLSRDADDTITFHTNLNTTHITQPPPTPHAPEPAPVLPATPWHHTSHWIKPDPAMESAQSRLTGEWDCEFAWPVKPMSSTGGTAASWLVFAESSLGADVDRVLGDDVSVTIVSPSVLADDTAGTTLLDSLGGVANVLYAPDVWAKPFDAEVGIRLFSAARRLTAALATVADPPKLFMLAREPVSEEDRANPVHAILWGLGRTLALEHPEIWGGVIDLVQSAPTADSDVADGGHQETTTPVGPIKDVWRVCEPEVRRSLLHDHVAVLVAAVMGLPSAQALNPSTDFFELGMDSLMSVVLQRALAETLGEVIEQSVVFDYPTTEALAGYLATIGDADQELAGVDLSEKVN
jgi:acyl transferase domain-containing protein